MSPAKYSAAAIKAFLGNEGCGTRSATSCGGVYTARVRRYPSDVVDGDQTVLTGDVVTHLPRLAGAQRLVGRSVPSFKPRLLRRAVDDAAERTRRTADLLEGE